MRNIVASASLRRRLRHVSTVLSGLLGVAFSFAAGWLSLNAAEIDPSKLPPVAQRNIVFENDIKPILEQSCFRCHGPEKPKSHFRLDNRESALKGGENGVDIISGDSARSPLIHYVARVVEDMEMPPPGKGEPLTSAQIGLLRAWIDQGANWPDAFPPEERSFVLAPMFRWIHVEGDKAKFREIEGMREGTAEGIEHFELKEQLDSGRVFTAEGRALFQDQDYQVKLRLEKKKVGFISGGFEQWRKYYDDSGGYYRPYAQPSYALDRNLYLDVGRAWIEFGLLLPDWPQMVLGYEYQFRQGEQATLEWGNVGGTNLFARNIYPAARTVDERTHVLKFDLVHDLYDWHLEENARVEIFNLRTASDDVANPLTVGGSSGDTVRSREMVAHVQGQNTVHLERQFTDWLFFSGGYLYSRFAGDGSLNLNTLDQAGAPAAGLYWSSDNIVLKRETHSFSLAGQLTPWEGAFVTMGFQPEWTHQEGFGNVQYSEGSPGDPSFLVPPVTLRSDLDEQKFSEQLALRYTKIPWTVLFAEARWEQDQIGQFERQTGDEANLGGGHFLRQTDYANDRDEYRVGFNTSPWRSVSFNAQVKRRISDSAYDSQKLPAGEGYSAFVRGRRIDTDEVQIKLVLRPANWLKTTLAYQHVQTRYETATDPVTGGVAPGYVSPGGSLAAGSYEADVYSVSAALTPIRRLSLAATFSYSDARTVAARNQDASVAPYQGDSYTILSTASYAVNEATLLEAAYTFSRANYDQGNAGYGLPLGLNYVRHAATFGVTRRLSANLSMHLRYAFYRYDEPSSGASNDYKAQGVFATLTMKWP